jgi:hypothetical protein
MILLRLAGDINLLRYVSLEIKASSSIAIAELKNRAMEGRRKASAGPPRFSIGKRNLGDKGGRERATPRCRSASHRERNLIQMMYSRG